MLIDVVQCFEEVLELITHVFYPDLVFLQLTPHRHLPSQVPVDFGHCSLKYTFCLDH